MESARKWSKGRKSGPVKNPSQEICAKLTLFGGGNKPKQTKGKKSEKVTIWQKYKMATQNNKNYNRTQKKELWGK